RMPELSSRMPMPPAEYLLGRGGQAARQNISSAADSGDIMSPRFVRKGSLSMHVLSPALCALALMSVSGPALALDSWTATTERGLPVLSLTQGDGSLRIVCDPDRVFGPTPNGAVIVVLPKDKAPNTVVFL